MTIKFGLFLLMVLCGIGCCAGCSCYDKWDDCETYKHLCHTAECSPVIHRSCPVTCGVCIGAHYALLFPRKGISDYVMIKGGMPSLKAVTVCLWIKTTDTGNYGTPLSYAVSGSDNELLLQDYRKFSLDVRGSTSGYQATATANDGKWHHICATWENTAGSWKLFKDGGEVACGTGLATGEVIRGGGDLVLGQDQDTLGGRFTPIDSFIGEMTDVNIWDHVITDQEITLMSKSCLTGVGNVFQWRDFKAHLKGSVQIIEP